MTVLATAGHVDHGKSSLVMTLTGTDPDRFEEEKRRGLTIDLGFAHTTLPSGAELSFVDVPGHVRFLRNMLAGVGGVAGCVFVVAATEGWKEQSEEHLRILELLGIERGLMALTKVDLVDDEWLELAELDLADHVEGTFLADAPVFPVSSYTGAGIEELRAGLDELVAGLAPAVDPGRAGDVGRAGDASRAGDVASEAGGSRGGDGRARTRLWVDRVFAAKGSGTVVTGTLALGAVAVDDRLVLQPQGAEVRVRGIQTAGAPTERIGAGHRVALNLSGVGHDELGRGDALVDPDSWHLTARVDASLTVLDTLDHDVSRRGAYVAYIGSGEHPVKMRVLGREVIPPGGAGAVRLFLPVALPLVPGDRFVLRESGRDETVGGGEILDVDPVLRASRAVPDRSVARVIAERGWVLAEELERLTGEWRQPNVGRWVATVAERDAMAADLTAMVDQAGAEGVDTAVLDDRQRAVLDQLDDVVVEAGRARPADAQDPFADHPLLDELLAGGFAPPVPDGVPRSEIRELTRRGMIVERDGICFHASVVAAAAQVAATLLATTPDGFTVSQFRDATGASRKFALPLLAELDATGVTRRRDDVRIAGPRLPAAS